MLSGVKQVRLGAVIFPLFYLVYIDITSLNFYLDNFSSFFTVVQHSGVKALLPFVTVEYVLQHSPYLYGRGARRFRTIFVGYAPFARRFVARH